MKNAFKLGFLALALSLTVVACNADNKGTTTDTVGTDTTLDVSVDTNVKDTVVTTTVDTTVKTN